MTQLLQSQQTLYLKEKERLDNFTYTKAITNKAKGAIKLINENKFTVLLATSIFIPTALYVVNEFLDGEKASSDSYGGTDGEITKTRDQFITDNQKYTIDKVLANIAIGLGSGVVELATIMYFDRNRLSKAFSSETLNKMESLLEEIKLTSKKELGPNLTNPKDKNQRQTIIEMLSKYEDEFKDNIKHNATVCFEKDTETQNFDLKVAGFINFLHECQNIILEEYPEILKDRSLNVAQVQSTRPRNNGQVSFDIENITGDSRSRNNGQVSFDIEVAIPEIKQRISELKYKPLKAPPAKPRKKNAVIIV